MVRQPCIVLRRSASRAPRSGRLSCRGGGSEMLKGQSSVSARSWQHPSLVDMGIDAVSSPHSTANGTAAGARRILGPYHIVAEKGTGAFGTVYLAEDSRTGRPAAVRVPPRSVTDEPSVAATLRRRGPTVIEASQTHPGLVRVPEYGTTEDGQTAVMERASGAGWTTPLIAGHATWRRPWRWPSGWAARWRRVQPGTGARGRASRPTSWWTPTTASRSRCRAGRALRRAALPATRCRPRAGGVSRPGADRGAAGQREDRRVRVRRSALPAPVRRPTLRGDDARTGAGKAPPGGASCSISEASPSRSRWKPRSSRPSTRCPSAALSCRRSSIRSPRTAECAPVDGSRPPYPRPASLPPRPLPFRSCGCCSLPVRRRRSRNRPPWSVSRRTPRPAEAWTADTATGGGSRARGTRSARRPAEMPQRSIGTLLDPTRGASSAGAPVAPLRSLSPPGDRAVASGRRTSYRPPAAAGRTTRGARGSARRGLHRDSVAAAGLGLCRLPRPRSTVAMATREPSSIGC